MKKFYLLIFLVFICFISTNKANSDETKEYVDEIVDDLVVYRSYIDGFKYLTEREKLFAYYMTKASIAGRDIFFDQMHEYAIDIRDILSEILLHSEGIDQNIVKNIKHYLYLIWNFGCNYDLGTDFSKIVPRFTQGELQTAAGIAVKNGASIDVKALKDYENIIFNKDFEPYLVVNNSIEESAVNFYIGDITTNEVIDYYNNYNKPVHRDSNGNILGEIGLNTKLVKGYAGLFRSRKILREQYPHELYPNKINKIIYYLNKALKYGTDNQKGYLNHLINYLRTGDVYYWHLFNREWLADNPVVDFMLGFVEVYQDPLNRKGSYEGIVNYIDKEETERQKIIAENVQYYENNAPWDEAYKKQWENVPVAKSIDVIVETGDAQTCCISGIILPNEAYLRDNYGSKAVQIVNTTDAINKGYDKSFG
ncbi:MAG: hypothetical protein SVN78_00990, partial [Deferribacterota bacterium]|nr:hypothetical protein [Deferribacterota bacterium]